MTDNQLAKALLKDPDSRLRMDLADTLRDMAGLALGMAQEGDERLDRYLDAHKHALALLAGLTGEGKE